MSVWEYVSSKAVSLCFAFMAVVVLAVIMAVCSAPMALVGTACLLFLLLAAAWLGCGYCLECRRLRRLERMMEVLPQKYLLGEVLPAPVNAVERQYFSVMKAVSRSAIGLVERSQEEKEEYCRYVESWIHEIKTPLTACSLILDNDPDPRKLRRELKRADNLTETILYYARLRTPDRDLKIEEFSLAPVMEEAVKSQMELLIAAGVSVQVQGDFRVYADRKSLCFILKQLLLNSAKYSPGCQISLTAQCGVLSVQDNGIGIPSHEIRRVTQRGFTGTNGRRLGTSTGMGLYLVSQLCGQMGIRLEIQSREGEFTRVSLEFETLTKL